MSREAVERFVPAEGFVPPNGTRIDSERFYRELCHTRRNGYCTTTGLVDASTHCIAVPIRNAKGVAVACVCVVTAGRLNGDRKQSLVRVLQEGAACLSSYRRSAWARSRVRSAMTGQVSSRARRMNPISAPSPAVSALERAIISRSLAAVRSSPRPTSPERRKTPAMSIGSRGRVPKARQMVAVNLDVRR